MRPLRCLPVLPLSAALAAGLMSVGCQVSDRRSSEPTSDTQAPPPAAASARSGAVDALVRSAREAVRRRPRDAGAHLVLATAYMRKQRESDDAAYYGRAEAAARRSLELAPDNNEALKTLAWVRLGQHRFRDAKRLAERCAQQNPADPMSYGILGDACVELGEYNAAVAAVQKMVDRRPGMPAYARVAYLRELHGQREGALHMMRQAARASNPAEPENRAWCWTQVGDLLFGEGKLKEARREYDVALFYRPGYPPALAGKAQVAAAERKLAEAEQLLTEAIAASPRPEFRLALGDVYALAGKKQRAREEYERFVRAEQAEQAAGEPEYRSLVLFYADHDRNLKEALSLARREYAGRKDIFTCDALAWALYKNGRYAEAWRLAQQAMRLNTQDARLLFHTGMIAAKLGDRPAAQKYLYQALSLNPHFHPVDATVAASTLKRLGSAAPM